MRLRCEKGVIVIVDGFPLNNLLYTQHNVPIFISVILYN